MAQMRKVSGWDMDTNTKSQNTTTVHIGCTNDVLARMIKQKSCWQRSLSIVRDMEEKRQKGQGTY